MRIGAEPGQDVVGQVSGRLDHAAGAATGAQSVFWMSGAYTCSDQSSVLTSCIETETHLSSTPRISTTSLTIRSASRAFFFSDLPA
jgi:hypothetical protein